MARAGESRAARRVGLLVLAAEFGGQSGWSLTHMTCIYARFGHGDRALTGLDTLTRACLANSFMTLHNDWREMGLSLSRGGSAPRQLDANMVRVCGFVQTRTL